MDHKLVRSLNNQRTPPNNHVFHRTTVRPKNNPSLRTDEKRTHDFDNIQLSNSWDTILVFSVTHLVNGITVDSVVAMTIQDIFQNA